MMTIIDVGAAEWFNWMNISFFHTDNQNDNDYSGDGIDNYDRHDYVRDD